MAEFRVQGEYEPSAAEPCGEPLASLAVVPVELQVSATAVQPAAARMVPGIPTTVCAQPSRLVVATSSMPELRAELLDARGERFLALNAAPEQQVTLSVTAKEPRVWSEDQPATSLSALRFPGVAGTIEIAPAFGEATAITVADAAAVSDFEVVFALGGTAGDPTPLEDGARYAGGWGRTSNRLAPCIEAAWVGEDPLCALPDPAWFELHADTPERCEVRPLAEGSLDDAVVLPRHPIGLSAYVQEDGLCRLRLRVPRAADGEGLEYPLSVTLENVADMHRVP